MIRHYEINQIPNAVGRATKRWYTFQGIDRMSLRRFRIASSEVTKRTEKEWARYRPRTDSIHMAAVSLQLRKASARTRCADTKRQSNSAL